MTVTTADADADAEARGAGIGPEDRAEPGRRAAARRRLAILFTAETVSALGSKTSFFAVPWLVLVTTGSPEQMGLVAAAELIPYVLVGLVGAPLIDRNGPWRTSVVADLVSTVAMVNVALAASRGAPGGLAMLAFLVALAGGARGLADRSRSVLLRPAVDAAGMDLTRATTIYDGIGRLSLVVGAPVGGLLIALLGPAGAVWLDAGSFALCALLVATGLRPAAAPAAGVAATGGDSAVDPDEKPPPYLRSLVEGARFLWRDKLLFGLTTMFLVTNLCTQAASTVFIPLWVRDVFGSAAGLGLVTGSFALGALAGNVAFTVLAPRLPRYLALVVGSVVGGAPRLLILAASTDLTVVLVVSFLSGVALASVNPIIGALLYERVPARLQARVFGVSAAISFAGLPLGGLVGGWAAQHIGLHPALLIFGTVFLVASLLPLARRASWRPLVDRRPAPGPSAPARASARGRDELVGRLLMVLGGMGLLVALLLKVPSSPWYAPASRTPVLLLIALGLAGWITGVVLRYPGTTTARIAAPAASAPAASAAPAAPAHAPADPPAAATVPAEPPATTPLIRAAEAYLSRPVESHVNRATELYVRAAEHLGSPAAPVRLAGLHALERLAQDNPVHRTSVVHLVCAYLRLPYTPLHDDAQGERQVRLAAQRMLAEHLRPAVGDDWWGSVEVDLTGATLADLDLSGCQLRHAVFDRATFTGESTFASATFDGDTRFTGTLFTGRASFERAVFTGDARFDDARFSDHALFDRAVFAGDAGFARTTFTRDATFHDVRFDGNVWFDASVFHGASAFGSRPPHTP